MMDGKSAALVLGGGGLTGIGWMTGLLRGLEEEGLRFGAFDRVVGTSAGSVVGAQVTGGRPLRELYEAQVRPGRQGAGRRPPITRLKLAWIFGPALLLGGTDEAIRRRIGKTALKTSRASAPDRRSVIAQRLGSRAWPTKAALWVTAVDATTGELRSFGRDSGVNLVDAVAASCAVPGLWPTVRVQGRDYMDGGVPSPENSLLAAGHDVVLILSPLCRKGRGRRRHRRRLRREVGELERGGSRVVVVEPDFHSRRAMGKNPMDPRRRSASAQGGRAQGRNEAAGVMAAFL